jgi:hypothetical protein
VKGRQGFLVGLALTICFISALPGIGAPPADALSFTPPVHYVLGGRPADLASADLNGDGRPNIVASAGSGIDILLGVGRSGGFAPAKRISLEHRPGAVALADINRDAVQDVVTASTDGTVTVLLGDGTGSFVAKGTFPTGPYPTDVVVGDLSGDDAPDVATANGGGLSILDGDGTGSLLPPLNLPIEGERSALLVAADFDLDGRLDLAASRYSWDEYSGFAVLLGDGAGSFSPPAFYDPGNDDSSPHGLAACELNNDGIPDLALIYGYEGGSMYAFLGDGIGIFVRIGGTVFGGDYDDAWGLAVADLNRDGLDDMVTIGQRPGGNVRPPGPPRIDIMLSHGDAVYYEPTSFLAGRLPGAVIAADFNSDRKPNLATTDVETRSVSVRLRGVLPVLIGVSPTQGRIGNVVTLTGRHFALSHGVVRFGSKTATNYVSRSASKIRSECRRHVRRAGSR